MRLKFLLLGLVAVMPGAGLLADDKSDLNKEALKPDKEGFFRLFNGKDLEGWKASENPATFKVEEGSLIVHGPRAHLFYVGPVKNHDFKNFHLKVEAQTFPKANSGIYFHTEYQETDWPRKGFECQVNQTHGDVKKTGGLYAVKDVLNLSPVKDNEWYVYDIVVKDKTVTIKVNGKTTAEWTQPDDWQPPAGMPGRKLSSGTIAIQGHDPESKVLYRSIKIKPLD
jgi:hypothetical protein